MAQRVRGPGPVRRLRVLVSLTGWQVIEERRVGRMNVSRSRDLPASPRRTAGAWFEALDAEGNVVYRRPIEHPGERSVELFEGGRIFRKPLPGQEVSVEFLVPEAEDVSSVRVVIDGKEIPYRHGKQRQAGYQMTDRPGKRSKRGSDDGNR
ncbi:hypothetical protein GCM10012275_41670 [Longimycelium tulufanense]|uniref:Uncharacterized protein n=1 Tax=Longimycelium tulufanense TaxID=907463 RepID=A0A8J3FVV8_9PSEU|nr:hypothetical protein [Longimycelium tulufanense]GGM66881.1 hypothetical protein GCM10012275_41670 [Longimycelium tulufanense]